MDAIKSFIKNLSLSANQWIMLVLAGIVGVLIVLLGLQGSRLHKVQVLLLQAHLAAGDEKANNTVQAAKDRFNKAYQNYVKTRSK